MVLTLVIVTDEERRSTTRCGPPARRPASTPRASSSSSSAGPRTESRLDAEVRSSATPDPARRSCCGMYGELADHAESVVVPLLLPDAPVVVWWPGEAPGRPGRGPAGRAGPAPGHRRGRQRRRRKDAADRWPHGYQPGDTDLAWTRATRGARCWPPRWTSPYGATAPRRGRGRGGQPERGTARGLARPAAGRRRSSGRVRRPRDHRGRLRRPRTGRSRCPGRDGRHGHAVPARPAGPPGGAAPARDRRAASPRSCAGSTRTRSTPRRCQRAWPRRAVEASACDRACPRSSSTGTPSARQGGRRAPGHQAGRRDRRAGARASVVLTGGRHRHHGAGRGRRHAGQGRGRLAAPGHLVGRRAVPARGRPGAQRDRRPLGPARPRGRGPGPGAPDARPGRTRRRRPGGGGRPVRVRSWPPRPRRRTTVRCRRSTC